MKVLLSWLREFAPLEASPEELAWVLGDLGTPVEEMTVLGEGLEGVVVARVLGLRSHPDADRIQLVDVDAGDGEARQICCGAFNMGEGDRVPLATLGATLPGGLTIERRKLRGEWSNGMLCSPAELGLGPSGSSGDDHGGILILPDHLELGIPLAEALGVERDVLYDLEVNPNRPDAMSVAGAARDLAARLGLPFTLPEPEVAPGGAPAPDATSVEIADPDLCGRFQSRVLRRVQVGESPLWMQRRLTLCGMRPINALVDISNYVMLELGQPNHPYDLAKVPGRGLRIRRAQRGETLVTLDDVERTFIGDDLLIADATDHAVGIAGIMGGAACEIDSSTTDVLLEMAWFLPSTISRTSRRLGLRTEASARFDKGADPEVIDRAADRFCQLAAEICGAVPAPGSVDRRGDLPDRPPVRLRTARVNAVLGTDLDTTQVAACLGPIGFTTAAVDGDLDVVVPSWRFDSSTEVDLIEEVARLHGYSRIEPTPRPTTSIGHLTPRQRARRELRRTLTGLGLTEVMPMPFLAPGALARCGLDPDGIELANPLVAEESVLRTSLLPGLIQAVAANAARGQAGVGLWEIGHVFGPPPVGQLLPDEVERLGVALAGHDASRAMEVWTVLAQSLSATGTRLTNQAVPGLHPTRSGVVSVGGQPAGVLGEVDPGVLADHGIDGRVAWLDLDLRVMLAEPQEPTAFRAVSRYPSNDIDLAFEVPDQVPADEVARTITSAAGALLWAVHLFDVYRGEPVPEGHRSLAYALSLVAPDRTLTDAEVAEVRSAAIDAVQSTHRAKLRG